MSDFDKTKDKLVFLAGSVDLTDKIQLQVSVRQYDTGPQKISILKVGKKADGSEWFSTTLDRLTAEQATKLSLLMVVAAEYMMKPATQPQEKLVRVIKRERKAPQPTI